MADPWDVSLSTTCQSIRANCCILHSTSDLTEYCPTAETTNVSLQNWPQTGHCGRGRSMNRPPRMRIHQLCAGTTLDADKFGWKRKGRPAIEHC